MMRTTRYQISILPHQGWPPVS